MPPPARPAAIVFDLDGTLVDTVGARIAAWEEALAEHGIPSSHAALEPLIGMDGRRLAAEVAAAAGMPIGDEMAEIIDRRAGERFDVHNREPIPLPGVRDALARLTAAGVTWAIATSSRRDQVGSSVNALHLAEAPMIVDGSAVEHAKPAPDLLLHAARELSADPAACWYVGDSTWDMQAARAAHMRPIAVLAGAVVDADALRASGAEVVLDTLDQLSVDG